MQPMMYTIKISLSYSSIHKRNNSSGTVYMCGIHATNQIDAASCPIAFQARSEDTAFSVAEESKNIYMPVAHCTLQLATEVPTPRHPPRKASTMARSAALTPVLLATMLLMAVAMPIALAQQAASRAPAPAPARANQAGLFNCGGAQKIGNLCWYGLYSLHYAFLCRCLPALCCAHLASPVLLASHTCALTVPAAHTITLQIAAARFAGASVTSPLTRCLAPLKSRTCARTAARRAQTQQRSASPPTTRCPRRVRPALISAPWSRAWLTHAIPHIRRTPSLSPVPPSAECSMDVGSLQGWLGPL